MLKTKIIRHADIKQNEIDNIIALKSVFWQYSYESQINWLKKNLHDQDLHLMVYDNEQLVGYLNLVNIQIAINGTDLPALGVGNVCTSQSGKGYGSVLMSQLNTYLLENNWIGILFCRSEIELFYAKFNWENIETGLLQIENLSASMMIFNFNLPIVHVKYDGKLF